MIAHRNDCHGAPSSFPKTLSDGPNAVIHFSCMLYILAQFALKSIGSVGFKVNAKQNSCCTQRSFFGKNTAVFSAN